MQERLGLRHETQRLLNSMVILHRYLPTLMQPTARPSQIAQILDQVQPVCLVIFPIVCDDPTANEHVRRYRAEWRDIQPEISGDDLRRMGIPRGAI